MLRQQILIMGLSYQVVSHVCATLGMARPRWTRTRVGNAIATAMDFVTCAATLHEAKSRWESKGLIRIPLISSGVHLAYVIMQGSDSLWRKYGDDYRQPSIRNGVFRDLKAPAAAADTACHLFALTQVLKSVPVKYGVPPALLGAAVCIASWKPWAKDADARDQQARQEGHGIDAEEIYL
jgi:hypothetical protein